MTSIFAVSFTDRFQTLSPAASWNLFFFFFRIVSPSDAVPPRHFTWLPLQHVLEPNKSTSVSSTSRLLPRPISPCRNAWRISTLGPWEFSKVLRTEHAKLGVAKDQTTALAVQLGASSAQFRTCRWSYFQVLPFIRFDWQCFRKVFCSENTNQKRDTNISKK